MPGNTSYKKIDKKQIQGWVRKEVFHLLPSAFWEDPAFFIRQTGGKVIRESRLRFAAIYSVPDGKALFFKIDRTKGMFESFKYLLLPSKARKEWFIACQVRKRNLSVPRPMGWMEKTERGFVKESYYFSEAVELGVPLAEIAFRLKDETIFRELVKMVIKMHSSGLLHQDLHAGNFLWDGKSFFLIDLHRAKLLRRLSLNQRLWSLAHLFHSLRAILGEREHLRFLDQYFGEGSVPLKKKEEYLHKIYFQMDRLQKRQWKSRTKRCLKESTEFTVQKEKGVCIYHRRDYPLNGLKEIIGKHLSLVGGNPSALTKYTPDVAISLLENAKGKVCVKQFCYPSPLSRLKEYFRRSKGLKSWINGNGLRVRGVSALLPLGFMERWSWLGLKESFFVMETSDHYRELDRYLLRTFENLKRKRLFLRTFARWVAQLHLRGLYHQDMKASNILVSERNGIWDFYLLDMEDVALEMRVTEKKLLKSFTQLHTSIPKILTKTDRYRCFKEYIHWNPIIKEEKAFLKRLVSESKKRGSVYFSS